MKSVLNTTKSQIILTLSFLVLRFLHFQIQSSKFLAQQGKSKTGQMSKLILTIHWPLLSLFSSSNSWGDSLSPGWDKVEGEQIDNMNFQVFNDTTVHIQKAYVSDKVQEQSLPFNNFYFISFQFSFLTSSLLKRYIPQQFIAF